MGIFDTFTKRLRKKERAGQPDIYVYDDLPTPLRVQMLHVFHDSIGSGDDPRFGNCWEVIDKTISKERGVFRLNTESRPVGRVSHAVLTDKMPDVLDVIELGCIMIDSIRSYSPQMRIASMDSESALAEINARFYEHSIGYQFQSGELIRVDSALMHAETIKPALHLLSDPAFSGANAEFLKAHEHYRHGRFEESMVDALKAFESVMKTICGVRHWEYDPSKATASNLIDIVCAHGLIPSFIQSEFGALAAVLKSGTPTIRNKVAGHGSGATPRVVPRHFAGYALHTAAANIVFLVESHLALK
jgi:AbiJ N-terminal domain 4